MVSSYIPPNNARGFPFLCILGGVCLQGVKLKQDLCSLPQRLAKRLAVLVKGIRSPGEVPSWLSNASMGGRMMQASEAVLPSLLGQLFSGVFVFHCVAKVSSVDGSTSQRNFSSVLAI